MEASGTIAPAPRLGAVDVEMRERPDGTLLLRSRETLAPGGRLIHDDLFHWARVRPDTLFLAQRTPDRSGWTGVTYAEAADRVDRIAASLVGRGLNAETPVAVLSGAEINHALLAFACMTAGIPCSPVSVPYSLASSDHGKLRHVVTILNAGLVYAADGEAFATALSLPEMAGREIVVGSPTAALPEATPFEALLDGGDRAGLEAARAQVTPEHVARILFTSGSTGVPKGVMITHRASCANAQMLRQGMPFVEERPMVLLDWLPWNHVFGGSHNINLTLRMGGTLHIDDGRPLPGEIERTFENLRDVSPSLYFNVPRGFDMILRAMEKDDGLRHAFFRDLDAMFYSGAGLAPHVWRGLEEMGLRTTGRRIVMISGWGLTETGPSITLLTGKAGGPDGGLGNIGTPMPGVELKLVPNGGKLEGRVRGPAITPGYWRMPEATARAFDEEGYFCTGDAIRFAEGRDPDLGFFFDGRVVEDFKLGSGTFVHTGDVRVRALKALGPLVRDVVVTGPDRPDLGLILIPPPGHPKDAADYAPNVAAALRRMNERQSGSSRVVARAIPLHDALSLDKGEITDKGSINMRAVLQHRATLLDRLYDDADPEVIRP